MQDVVLGRGPTIELRDEVSKLKVTGGMANPERLAGKWGIGLTIFGFVVAIVSFIHRCMVFTPYPQAQPPPRARLTLMMADSPTSKRARWRSMRSRA